MKILIATGIFPPEPGGPALYAVRFSEELKRQGHEVLVVSYSDKNKYSFDDFLGYEVFRILRKNMVSNYLRYFKAVLIASRNVDIIYAFDYFSAGIPVLFAAKMRGKKLAIRNGGDLVWERYLDKYETGVTLRNFYEKKLYRKFFIKFLVSKIVLKSADFLIFTTKLQSDIFIKYYGLNQEKVFNIENPIPFEIKTGNFDFAKQNRNKEIIWAGRMVNKNNLRKLINVFSMLSKNNFKLVLIGDGPLKKNLALQVARYKLQDEVFVEDKMPNDKLVERIAGAYAVVFPAYTDISPVLLLETLAVKTPFILTCEHGFDWLKGKAVEFDPTDKKEMESAFLKIMDKIFYNSYEKEIDKIEYNYTFNQAVKDTIKIFEKI